jgi:hypothetical protein
METEEIQKRLRWVETSKGRYLLFDMSNVKGSDAYDLTFDFLDMINLEPDNSILMLYDVTGNVISIESMSNLRSVSKKIQRPILRSGIVGLSSAGKAIFPIYKTITKSKARLFATREDAIDYLFS